MSGETNDHRSWRLCANLDECMHEADQWCLEMQADSGGWPLLVCPVSMIRASEDDREQLLLDLESIVFGGGFETGKTFQHSEAQEMLLRTSTETVVAGSWHSSRGVLCEGIWFENTINEPAIRDQVISIITGKQHRLEVPEWWPNFPPVPHRNFESLDEARPLGRNVIAYIEPRGLGMNQPMIKIPVDLVMIEEDELVRLSEHLARLDSLADQQYIPATSARKSTIRYEIQSNMRDRRLNEPRVAEWLEARGLLDFILSVLAGRTPAPDGTRDSGS